MWSKGWQIFIWSLSLNERECFHCEECPEELVDENDHELNYEAIECHIADGIDMGNVTNMVKGIPEKELFADIPPAGAPSQKGIDAPDRTFIRHVKNRAVLADLSTSLDEKSLSSAIKKISARGRAALPRCKHMTAVGEVLKHISQAEDTSVKLEGYRLILKELHLLTPVISNSIHVTY